MSTPFNSQAGLQNLNPEVKSFIYQTILDFEPFTTPETVIHVIAKNPSDLLLSQFEEDSDNVTRAFDLYELPPKRQLAKMHRIAITLTEGDSRIEAEAIHEDIYGAIVLAKEHMLKTLSRIQDDVVSAQDRTMQIRQALASGNGVH